MVVELKGAAPSPLAHPFVGERKTLAENNGGSAGESVPSSDAQSSSGDQTADDELTSLAEDTPEDPEVKSVLSKMEELNRSNEADLRSVTSKRSSGSQTGRSSSPSNGPPRGGQSAAVGAGDSGNCAGEESPMPRSNSLQPALEDDDLDLWTLWGNLVKSWELEWRKRPSCVKELVRRGIPQHFRTIAWQLLSGACAGQAIHEQYAEYIRQSSPYEKTIARDIPRTFPELDFFKDGGRGQQSLFNIIKAYSLHDREVGYCQGSAFIVGQLLLQMPEEEAFAVLVRLMEFYRLRELYKPSMAELGLCMFQLEVMVQEQMPDLNMHFNNMGFDTSMYASSWFLTLFLTTLPLELANRIMDWFLVDGMDAIFRIALSILQQARVDLLQLDMEGMLKYFQREVRERYENDHELLFAVASRVHLNAKKMKKLEKEYLSKRTKEQEEAIELRRLRTENRLLRQRIDYLERESSALAGRLVRGQVDLAQQADNCLNISHELNLLRDINSDAHRRLEDAYETIRELSSDKERERGEGGGRKTGEGGGRQQRSETGVQVDDSSMIEHIHQLQQELIETHSKKADLESTVREMKSRINGLESANKRLKESPPDGGVAAIQEELIRVKMREAEATLSLKEMRQRLAEVEQQWQRFMLLRGVTANQLSPAAAVVPDCPNPPSLAATAAAEEEEPPQEPCQSPTPAANGQQQQQPQQGQQEQSSGQQPAGGQSARARIAKLTATLMGAVGSGAGTTANGEAAAGGANSAESLEGWTQRELEDQFVGLKIREADTLAELKEMRQKVMELETQNHVCSNQLKRQDEEMRRLREERETGARTEKELREELRDSGRQLMILQSEMKEKNVMQRLKYTEALQTVAELKQQMAQMESKVDNGCADMRRGNGLKMENTYSRLKKAESEARAKIRGTSVYDLDNSSLASSTRSVASLDGEQQQSLCSEEMAAFIAGIRAAAAKKEEDDGAETETNEPEAEEDQFAIHSQQGQRTTIAEKTRAGQRQHNDNSDSGLSLDEHSPRHC